MVCAVSQICDRDCFNCRFDDCICDEMTADDWKAARGIDDFIHTKTAKEKTIAAYQKRYYEENREALISFGDALRAVRKRLKLSQADAGRLVGLSQRQISYYERGEVPFDLSIIEKLKGYESRLGL